jgi:hypothetical protein
MWMNVGACLATMMELAQMVWDYIPATVQQDGLVRIVLSRLTNVVVYRVSMVETVSTRWMRTTASAF